MATKGKQRAVLAEDTPAKAVPSRHHADKHKRLGASPRTKPVRVGDPRNSPVLASRYISLTRPQEHDQDASRTEQDGDEEESLGERRGEGDEEEVVRSAAIRPEDSWTEFDAPPERPDDSIDPREMWFEDDREDVSEEEPNSYDDEMRQGQEHASSQESDEAPTKASPSMPRVSMGLQWQTDRARPVGIKGGPWRRSTSVIARDMASVAAKKEAARSSLANRSISHPIFKRPLVDPLQRHMSLHDSQPTGESIPPPPAHVFQLSRLTPLSVLLRQSHLYLAEHQGGAQPGPAEHFSILVLVVRVGPLEEVRDWKGEATAGTSKRAGPRPSLSNGMMDRAEVIVRDKAGFALKVDLHANCASEWAGSSPQLSQSISASSESSQAGCKGQSGYQLDNESSSRVNRTVLGQYSANPNTREDSTTMTRTEATIARNNTTTFLGEDTTVLEKKRVDRMLPLRPGDVVALSNLVLVKPRSVDSDARKTSTSRRGKTGRKAVDQNDTTAQVYAVASPRERATMELCWRNEISSRTIDAQRNFEDALVDFDPRCKAIWELAKLW